MAFRFQLEPLLRLRRSQQRQQELVLQRITDRVGRITHELKALEDEMHAVRSRGKSAGPVSGAELQFDQQRCEILAESRAQTLLRLKDANEQRSLALNEFLRMWREAEALELLRREQRNTYTIEEARNQQRVQDELFLQRKQKSNLCPEN